MCPSAIHEITADEDFFENLARRPEQLGITTAEYHQLFFSRGKFVTLRRVGDVAFYTSAPDGRWELELELLAAVDLRAS